MTKQTITSIYPAEMVEAQISRYSEAEGKMLDIWGGSSKDVRYFRAPGRVNLAGNHTDHNGGLVLPFAVEDDALVVVRPNGTNQIRAYSMEFDGVRFFELDDLAAEEDEKGDWKAFLRGVANYITGVTEHPSYKGEGSPQGIDLVVTSNVAIGSGLSSSASFTSALALAIDRMWRVGIEAKDLARIAQRAENVYFGKNCGLMDQFISLCAQQGSALLINFQTEIPTYEVVDTSAITEQGYKVVVVNSGVRHSGIDDLYNDIREDMQSAAEKLSGGEYSRLADVGIEKFRSQKRTLSQRIADRASHFFYECQRVREMAMAFSEGDVERAAHIMYLCGESSRYVLKNTCLPELPDREVPDAERRALDILTDLAGNSQLAIGQSMFGGGFGGCTRQLVKADDVGRFEAYMVENAAAQGLSNITVRAYTPRQGACEVMGV